MWWGLAAREALHEGGWGSRAWLQGGLRCFGRSGTAPVPGGCELIPKDMNFLVEGFAPRLLSPSPRCLLAPDC